MIKRGFDLCFALLASILLLPIFIFLCLVLFIYEGKPIFFKQNRPGKKEKIFKLIKFNTMTPLKPHETTETRPDHTRITKIGSWMRKTSLDEIPQLINVIKGDISLVGPRPLLTEYLPLYNQRQKLRHTVMPGITGWAQINGRNTINWEQKFEFDIWYVENWSLFLDLKILFLTLFKVFRQQDVNASETSTMTKFTGTSDKN
jgi:lipopolysaccharide/colanic/teichoic acid biosynthesis glycosyltransferase